jgi:hypothetical protein
LISLSVDVENIITNEDNDENEWNEIFRLLLEWNDNLIRLHEEENEGNEEDENEENEENE